MNFKYLLLALLLFGTASVFGQQNQQIQASKQSPLLLLDQFKKKPGKQEAIFIIAVKNQKQFSDSVQKIPGITIISVYEPAGLFFIRSTYSVINNLLLWENVLFADINRKPIEELFTGTIDNATNTVNKIHSLFPLYNGNGMTLGIKENNFDTSDIDFRGRYLINPAASASVTSHASIMGTISAGGGNSWYATKGAAWGGRIVSSSFANLLPDINSFYQQYGVTVQNHSYGTGIENYYGAEAMAYDLFAINNPTILHIFSSGNSGAQTPPTGIYNTINGFANLTGNFKMAKNIITVGETDSFHVVPSLSSKGPAYDGRVKPELVALGADGSSGAAAIVSGVAISLQQAFKTLNNGNLPASSLIKAILLNSADDTGLPELDFKSGFGSLNAYKAMQTITSGNFASGTVTQSQEQNYTISIPAGIRKLKITLVWNDPPATVNAVKALVNDLDLECIHSMTSQVWQPWVLSSFPHIDSLLFPAGRKRDSLNNAEQITIENPAAGNYVIKIKGYALSTALQTFSLAWQMDSGNSFEWNYPTQSDPILAGEQNILRWNTTLASGTGTIQYSINNGNSWQIISSTVDLSKNYFTWNAPLIYSKTLLKIIAGGNEFVSDTFVISKPLSVSVGFNCTDSFMLYWSKLNEASRYQVYKLGAQYLEPLLTTADTAIVFQKSNSIGLHYTVAPVISGREGVKGFTINYTTQGVQCFIRSFFAEKIGATARLHLQLGTLYGITKVVLQKIYQFDTVSLETINNPSSLNFTFNDNQLLTGFTQYRIYLETSGGSRIYSDIAQLYYTGEEELFVFPSPVKKGESALVILNEKQTGWLQLTDMAGRVIQSWLVTTEQIPIPTNRLQAGMYLLRLAGNNRKIKTGRLIVY